MPFRSGEGKASGWIPSGSGSRRALIALTVFGGLPYAVLAFVAAAYAAASATWVDPVPTMSKQDMSGSLKITCQGNYEGKEITQAELDQIVASDAVKLSKSGWIDVPREEVKQGLYFLTVARIL